ncbi:hypothetical protein [Streptomyces sp. V3I7]|uniref:hypothetical protein n=1 Tax=Streptomyces sp. V3I7 TaxID=3042278 RepID=UPI0027D89227|nr:hypothetical protein [Streptomyces sp. V3I7]
MASRASLPPLLQKPSELGVESGSYTQGGRQGLRVSGAAGVGRQQGDLGLARTHAGELG